MRTVKAKPITLENFAPYGQFTDLLNPSGYSLGDFYHDRVKMNVSGNINFAFSPLVIRKSDPMIVTESEYHSTTQEAILCLDDDMILHLAPPSKVPVPELTEAIIVPQGTLVCINVGVWHMSPIPVNKDVAHVLISLPERTYFNDCTVVEYTPDQQIKIEL